MAEVLVALGSNVGDSLGYLREAVALFRERFDVLAVSGLYRTAPMYVTDQPDFLNGALKLSTELGPLQVLRTLKAMEVQIGRHKERRYGPREIDLDLLAYGHLQYRFTSGETVVLQVPHPRIPERRFVLAPLCDIDPNAELPGLGRVCDLLAQTMDQAASVQRVEDALF
jgi:2-amino-4-hydroxy-6-hydroxymethyldihydropteridine diphosphokinase